VKTTIIALSAAALIAAAPAVLAQGVPGKTPSLQHKVSRKITQALPSTLRCVRCKPKARRTSIRELSVTRVARF
jgi:hypothetical protein